jgi:hypothetical protein
LIGDALHCGDRVGVVRRNVLAAAGAIHLHGIVGRRIVAGRDDDAAIAFFVAHGERKFRRAAEAVEKINREAGRRHDLGAKLGEMPRAMPRVVSDGAAELALRAAKRFGRLFFYVIGQALGAFADRAVVDGVAADRTHASASSAGAERNDRPKGIFQFSPFSGRQMFRHFDGVVGQIRLGEPSANVGRCRRR